MSTKYQKQWSIFFSLHLVRRRPASRLKGSPVSPPVRHKELFSAIRAQLPQRRGAMSHKYSQRFKAIYLHTRKCIRFYLPLKTLATPPPALIKGDDDTQSTELIEGEGEDSLIQTTHTHSITISAGRVFAAAANSKQNTAKQY